MVTEPAKPFDLDAVAILVDDARTEIVQASKTMTDVVSRLADPALMGTLTTIVRRLDTPQDASLQPLLEDLQHTINQLRPARRLPWYAWPASLALVGLLGLALGWHTSACPAATQAQARLAQHLDGLLVERFATLPAPLQAQITDTYTRAQVLPPGQRKAGKR